jgi:hypothetical protein
MLLGGSPEDSIVIELCVPYITSGDLLTIAAAIQQTDANVVVNCAYTTSTFETLVVLSCKSPNISEGFYQITPMKYFSQGTSADIKSGAEMYESYCDTVFSFLKEKGILSEEEIKSITEKDEILLLKTEDVRQRIGK